MCAETFLFVFIVALVLLFLWLSSRGRLAFLYCVAQNKGEFWNPWRQFRNEGNSLFAFRVAIGIISFLTIAGILVLGIAMLVTYHAALGLNFGTIVGIISWLMLFTAAAIVFGLLGKFTRDFVVPIMYARRMRCTEAWRVLLDVLAFNKGRFFLYLLFQVVIGMAIGALVLACVCVTCCCAGCIFMIPYIGTVALLPVLVFTRSYSLYYLAQYGPEFNVIAPEAPAAPAAPPADGYYG